VDELAQNWTRRVALHDGARLAEPHPAAAHRADRELVADELVERHPAGEDVATVLIGAERWVEGLAHLGLHERQCAAGQARRKGPLAADVAVTLEAASRERADRIDRLRRLARGR